MEQIRILHCLHSMHQGGAEAMLMNLFRQIDKTKLVFDFLLTDMSKEGTYEKEIRSLGGRIYKIPVMTISNPIPYLRALDSFFRNHNKEYRIVHSHTSSKSFFPLYYAKKWGIPVRISHSHNNRSLPNLDGFIRNILKFPLKKVANNYFACAQIPAEWLYGKEFCRTHHVRIIYNAIDTDKYLYNEEMRKQLRNQIGVEDSRLVIGHVGRFSYQKNHLFLIDIFEKIKEINPDAILLLVGDGEKRDELKLKIKKLGLNDSVVFTGNVNNVQDYLQAMDVFVFPSLFEGLPVCMVEAQCTGLACVTSSEAVTKEVCITENVRYCSLNDTPQIWAKTIISMIPYRRESRNLEVKEHGYDIVKSTLDLQNFYIKKFQENIL